MRRLRVEVAAPYDVVIGERAWEQLPRRSGRLAVVVDENVHALHRARLQATLAAHEHLLYVLPSGEKHKTLETASRLFDWLAAHRFERQETLVAIGGGVAGDLSGFVAATWRRGVPFIQVPTTLLAQVDASVGGKVAVDHPAGKNLIGAFHQPDLVLADTALLRTLPERELWSGLAEVVKTALLAGEPLLSETEAALDALERGEADLDAIVAACVEYKAGVVRRDPFERGERAVLNLGHTVGHALEKLGGYDALLHGEAVALGLIAALRLSGHGPDARALRLARRLRAPRPHAFSIDDVLDAMKDDKKVEGGVPRFVLLEEAGCPRWGVQIDPGLLRETLEELLTP